MATQLQQLANVYRLLQKKPHDIVLATIIETMGSTYQKAGTRMLIARDGEFTGLLGGGCFETDLREQAESVFEKKQAKVVFYDMRSLQDEIWGTGLGCNGAARILLQCLSKENSFSPLNEIANAVERRQTGVLATICESNQYDYTDNQSVFYPATKQDHQFIITDEHPIHTLPAQRVLRQDKPALREHRIEGKSLVVFYDLIKPALRLLLLGGGPDAVPVTQFAKSLGWHTTIVDYRAAYITPERFSDVDQLFCITPDTLNEKLNLEQFDALVIMTHNMDYDRRYLTIIADNPIPYIGLLGPASRRDRLLSHLGKRAEKIKRHVYGPTGLDIGANTPEEIALSIIAEIQAVFANRDGGQLCQKTLPI